MCTNRGRGIEKICRECTQYGNPSPDYFLSAATVTVSFNAEDMPAVPTPEIPAPQLTERQKEILEYMRSNPEATYGELAKWCGVSERTVTDEIILLKNAGCLSRAGSRRKGMWVVHEATERDGDA